MSPRNPVRKERESQRERKREHETERKREGNVLTDSAEKEVPVHEFTLALTIPNLFVFFTFSIFKRKSWCFTSWALFHTFGHDFCWLLIVLSKLIAKMWECDDVAKKKPDEERK